MSKFKTASTMMKEWEEASKRIQTKAKIQAEAIRKFAEWVDENYETNHYMMSLVEIYEKEQTNA